MSQAEEIRLLKTLVENLKTRRNEGGQTITVPGVPAPRPIDTKNGDVKKNIEFFQIQWQNDVIHSSYKTRPFGPNPHS
jgi:hypothetical protein